MSLYRGLRLGLSDLTPWLRNLRRYIRLQNDPAVSSAGRAGSKNGSVTWSGGRGGQVMNPYTGVLWAENMCLWTEDFGNAAWTKANATLTAAQVGPDDGRLSATKLAAAADGSCSLRQAITVVAATTYTYFAHFKKGDALFALLGVDDGSATNRRDQYFDLTTGAVASTVQAGTYVKVSARMIDLLNGYYRCELTVTTPAGTSARIYAGLTDADGTDSLTAAKFGYVWGAMFHAGNLACPYYPVMGTALGPIIYSRQAMPGFTVPRVPQEVWDGSKWVLDAPFRHDFRVGQNMLVNSAWDGAVAGAPGTAPTGWTNARTGDGNILAVGAGSITFNTPAPTDRAIELQAFAVAANTSYHASVRILSLIGTPRLCEVIGYSGFPAGSNVTYFRNGVSVPITELCAAGDVISAQVNVAGTAGNATLTVGIFATGVTQVAATVTLTEPQVEPGTVRSVYTPTTTAAISAPVCEPVKSTEDGIFCMFHAQGARTNLVPVLASGSIGLTNTLSGITRTIIEDTGNSLHRLQVTGPALTDSASYRSRVKIAKNTGTAAGRYAYIYWFRAATAVAGVRITLDTGAVAAFTQLVGSALNLTTSTLADGSYLVQADISSTSWVGAVDVLVGISNSSAGLATYTGDGVSGFSFSLTLEAATFPGLPLGEGVALTVQGVTWNCASVHKQAFDSILGTVQYGFDGDIGTSVPAQTFAEFGNSGTAHRLVRTNTTVATLYDYNGAQQTGPLAIRTLPAQGVLFTHRTSRRPGGTISVSYNNGAEAASTFGGTWSETSGIVRLSGSSVAGREAYAASSSVYKVGGFTDGERALLALSFARTLSFLA